MSASWLLRSDMARVDQHQWSGIMSSVYERSPIHWPISVSVGLMYEPDDEVLTTQVLDLRESTRLTRIRYEDSVQQYVPRRSEMPI